MILSRQTILARVERTGFVIRPFFREKVVQAGKTCPTAQLTMCHRASGCLRMLEDQPEGQYEQGWHPASRIRDTFNP
jgi:hypothetical protein